MSLKKTSVSLSRWCETDINQRRNLNIHSFFFFWDVVLCCFLGQITDFLLLVILSASLMDVYVHAWVWNHDRWCLEEQRAWVRVHQDSVHLHPSPVNAAAAALTLWDTLLTSLWILGDLSCGVNRVQAPSCMPSTAPSWYSPVFVLLYRSWSLTGSYLCSTFPFPSLSTLFHSFSRLIPSSWFYCYISHRLFNTSSSHLTCCFHFKIPCGVKVEFSSKQLSMFILILVGF